MADLLFEVLCEEIPASMQTKAAQQLKAAITDKFSAARLNFEDIEIWVTPRRLGALIKKLPAQSADKTLERKGPKIDAPTKAIEGFLRGAGLNEISQAQTYDDPKKGKIYIARTTIKGVQTCDLVRNIFPEILQEFNWPKSMRSGYRAERWIRPINRILCILDGETISFSWGGIQSDNLTEGHRFLGRGPFRIDNPAAYHQTLEHTGFVKLSHAARREKIESDARSLCAEADLHLVHDPALLDELAGLSEWPVALMGNMDPQFLSLPDEVIQLSMRTHQKYLAVRDSTNTRLAPHFIVISNITAKDGGKRIKEGNARVLSARLNDAQFFWDQDIAVGLEKLGDKLSTITFKHELGSMADKVQRTKKLAHYLTDLIPADERKVGTATSLMKNDLVSQMVYEFPELQGVIGGYYAKVAGYDDDIVSAIKQHYLPAGASDEVAEGAIAIICSLADKFDTLAGFWAINQKPTSSKDPFALRRAALGVIRTLLTRDIKLPLRPVLQHAFDIQKSDAIPDQCASDLLNFFSDRLSQYLKTKGIAPDRIKAIFALGLDDLLDISNRAHALDSFLKTENGANLRAGFKRANNILDVAEPAQAHIDCDLFALPAENELFKRLDTMKVNLTNALKCEDYVQAMHIMANLRAPLDKFFDTVQIKVDAQNVRRNRLALLGETVATISQIADFSYIVE